MWPQRQLSIASVLLAGLIASASHLALSSSSELLEVTTDLLPVFADGDHDEPLERDAFDVTRPEDYVNALPVDEIRFWAKAKSRALALSIPLAVILVLQSIALGWTITQEDGRGIAIRTLHVAYALYALILSIAAIQLSGIKFARLVLHLTLLTSLATLSFTLSAIIPSSRTGEQAYSQGPLSNIWITVYALYFLSFLISVTSRRGPKLHLSPNGIYPATATSVTSEHDVTDSGNDSLLSALVFSYSTNVVGLGRALGSIEILDLPILKANMRAAPLYAAMRRATRNSGLRAGFWSLGPGSGLALALRLARLNASLLSLLGALSIFAAATWYLPAFFLRQLVRYLEHSQGWGQPTEWGLAYALGLFASSFAVHLAAGHTSNICSTDLQVRVKTQLNSILFAKALVRKDVASTEASCESPDEGDNGASAEEFSSKAQVMTLMTADTDRVSGCGRWLMSAIDVPLEIVIGAFFLYSLLGVSSFVGLAVIVVFMPVNHFAGKVMVGAQEHLMKARDERVSLMNEVLGAIRTIKFMAWERSFEERIMKVRRRELEYQRKNYTIEVLLNAVWNCTPIFVTLISFWHFTVIRKQRLTPSIAFTSISVLNEMRFAMNSVPQTLLALLQATVSLRRLEKYLQSAEIPLVRPSTEQPTGISLRSATVTWASDRPSATNAAATPRHGFALQDVTLDFPVGELSLVCGRLGSGKSLLLLALLGEADVVSGQVLCPRTPPDALLSLCETVGQDEAWVVPGMCAYVPQTAWLRNASIRDNILFGLPYVEERYQKTLEACALFTDLETLKDGDDSEIGERGVNLSGGQKARVSLARAVYSRASTLFLDDVLSAVDAHTARHIYHRCLKGELMHGRTAILVSHHVQLCAPGARYIVSLEDGRVEYSGSYEGFVESEAFRASTQSHNHDQEDAEEILATDNIEEIAAKEAILPEQSTSTPSLLNVQPANAPKKLVEDEKRAVGHIDRKVWAAYTSACGDYRYWLTLVVVLELAAIVPVCENDWLREWSGSLVYPGRVDTLTYYILGYAAVSLILTTSQWLLIYHGGINASVSLYRDILENVLFSNIRFHDITSRGQLLNRFGKDFEVIDSDLSQTFGQTIIHGLTLAVALVIMLSLGRLPLLAVTVVLAIMSDQIAQVYGHTSRELRRLGTILISSQMVLNIAKDSITRSPLYTIYGEMLSGITVVRAFGSSTKFLRDMLCLINANATPYYWMWGVNRWLQMRFGLFSSIMLGLTGLAAVLSHIDPAFAGFALTFGLSTMDHLIWLVRMFVNLEQSMVSVERVQEYINLPQEPAETIEPRPPPSWPAEGAISCENLSVRYAPDLPDVLTNLSFTIRPGEKIGILGRTGSGKSTLALSFCRFVEPVDGRILIDGLDISNVGLTDLRSKLTTIPQDPTILSGTLRSTLDVFNEYDDVEIFDALKRVHLIPADASETASQSVHNNVFQSLESPVSEGGENFSIGEKQLLCMARALLKRSKVLIMDEATASVDYATDELIGQTIRREFSQSTILTIAHRLRTIIDYDRVMVLDQGRIVEFDMPAALLSDPRSKFYALCQATGKEEFATLKKMAEG